MTLTYDFQIEASFAILFLSGKILSADKNEELLALVKEKIEAGNKKIITDISQLEYINSSGLNLFLKLFTLTRNVGGDLVLIHPNKTVAELLKISKLDTVFHLEENQEKAIKFLNKINE